jgi:hypothetical protein
MKKSPAERGYGQKHRVLRARWSRLVASGNCFCARCGQVILAGEPWDLGHDDLDRSEYTGPEHASCNRRAGGRNGGLARARQRRVVAWSREWL